MLRCLPLCLMLVLPVLAAAPDPKPVEPLRTVAERSGYLETGRYDEVIALCEAYAARYPQAVRCETFGISPEGRPMKLLVASRSGVLTPEAAKAQQQPVLLIQGGIHAGEIDGKDAGFLLLRELLDGETAKGALDHLVLLFVPVFNVDGHERFGAWNRPNQRGPREMGWRTTAQNLNLNRDYLKADAPEMQAMLGLVNRWDPILYADLHVTDGAQFEHAVSFNIEPQHGNDEGLRAIGRKLRHELLRRLTPTGALPLGFYPQFIETDNPASGFAEEVPPPRYSIAYAALRNRIGLLVETHSWKDYPTRVRVMHDSLVATVELTARDGRRWQAEATRADARSAQLGGQRLALTWETDGRAHDIAFRGYAYTREMSAVSGQRMTRYDETRPQVWTVPLFDHLRPRLETTVPKAGYWVPAALAPMVAGKLALHGVRYQRIGTAQTAVPVEAFRAGSVELARETFEGHVPQTFTGDWQPERRDLAAGSLFVPVAQPLARVVVALLDPQAPDSLASWGFFATAFESKEYLEDYVAEDIARAQLAADPALKAAFEARLAGDPAFAASAAQRLAFFASRHSSRDERLNLYPVLRADAAP